MENSTRSGAILDREKARKGPTAREAERVGRVGAAVEGRSFTIQPKTAVIEIQSGKVSFLVGKAAEG
jgi:hypothetical protein